MGLLTNDVLFEISFFGGPQLLCFAFCLRLRLVFFCSQPLLLCFLTQSCGNRWWLKWNTDAGEHGRLPSLSPLIFSLGCCHVFTPAALRCGPTRLQM